MTDSHRPEIAEKLRDLVRQMEPYFERGDYVAWHMMPQHRALFIEAADALGDSAQPASAVATDERCAFMTPNYVGYGTNKTWPCNLLRDEHTTSNHSFVAPKPASVPRKAEAVAKQLEGIANLVLQAKTLEEVWAADPVDALRVAARFIMDQASVPHRITKAQADAIEDAALAAHEADEIVNPTGVYRSALAAAGIEIEGAA